MSAILIDGRAEAKRLLSDMAVEVEALKGLGIRPGLCVILVGEDPASQVYVRNKAKDCEKVGIYSKVVRLPEQTTQAELLGLIDEVNRDEAFHGLLVQLPLPRHIDERAIIEAIDPKKDVDGFHPMNTGALLSGSPGMLPCTPRGVVHLLKRANVNLSGAEAVVVGRSNIVGKPAALLLLRENATVTVCHSKTANLAEATRRADVLVVAIGRPKFIQADMIKPGAAVIDVGMNRLSDGTFAGDVDFEAAVSVAGAITPVPGGVGPMTRAMLLRNTIDAAKR